MNEPDNNLPLRCCGRCRFWLPDPAAGGRTCHGAPPSAVILITQHPISGKPAQTISSAWPPTGADELCGMFQLKTQIKTEGT